MQNLPIIVDQHLICDIGKKSISLQSHFQASITYTKFIEDSMKGLQNSNTMEDLIKNVSATEENQPVSRELEESTPHGEEQTSSIVAESEDKATTVITDELQKELQEMQKEHETDILTEEDEDVDISEEIHDNYMHFEREQLLTALQELVKQEVSLVKNKIALIKLAFYSKLNEQKKALLKKFVDEGGNKIDFQEITDELEVKFKKELETYREKRKKHLEEQERIQQNNLKKRLEILEELKTLINSEETLKKTYDEFHTLQERWKEIGQVPRNEANTLWQNYHFLIEKFFDKVKINKELKMLDLKKNLESKIELCEKVEELIVETSINKTFKVLQDLREKWREIGPVLSEKSEEIWERFKVAVDQIEQRRREHYEKLKEEQDKNLLAKMALIEQGEQIVSELPNTIKEWNEKTTELNDLLKIWKTIGSVPKAQNNQIWERFKTSLDSFFTSKNEWFQKLKDEQAHNYNLKVELCLQAEAIAKRDDWKRATEELIKLQKEWKEIPGVSRKLADKVWLRFRSACDEFFERKSTYFKDIKSIEQENLAKKLALLEKVKSFDFSENKVENLNSCKEFQREWMEIGYVPIKEKERLQEEFRALINQLFEKLKISQQEAKEHLLRSRIINLKSEDIERFASKEKRDIQERIQKLKEDIHLWDNNLGFLASSKQAEILKREFEKKINHAKQDIALLEAQMKVLNEAKKIKEENKDVQS